MASGPTLPPQAYTREILTAAFNWLQTQPESVRKLATTPDALVGLYMRAQRYGNSTLESDAPVSSQSFMSDLKSLAEGLKQFESPQRSANSGGGLGTVTTGYAPQHSSSSNASPSPFSPQPMTPPMSQQLGQQLSQQLNQQTNQNTNQQNHQTNHQQMTPQQAAAVTSQMQAQIPLQTPQQIPNTAMFRSSYSPAMPPANHQMQAPSATQPAPTQQQASANSQPQLPQAYAPAMSPAIGASMSSTMPSLQSMQAQLQGPAMNEMSLRMIHEVKNALNLSSDAEAINMMLALAYKNLKNLLS